MAASLRLSLADFDLARFGRRTLASSMLWGMRASSCSSPCSVKFSRYGVSYLQEGSGAARRQRRRSAHLRASLSTLLPNLVWLAYTCREKNETDVQLQRKMETCTPDYQGRCNPQ